MRFGFGEINHVSVNIFAGKANARFAECAPRYATHCITQRRRLKVSKTLSLQKCEKAVSVRKEAESTLSLIGLTDQDAGAFPSTADTFSPFAHSFP